MNLAKFLDLKEEYSDYLPRPGYIRLQRGEAIVVQLL